MRYTHRPFAVLLFALCATSIGAQSTDWPYYAGDAFSSRYTSLRQIDSTNVGGLSVVWRYTPPDKAIAESNGRGYDTNRGTPIKVGDVLYYGSPYNILCAVDAQSGRELWTFDPGVWREGVGFVGNLRGIAYWSDGEVERIFFGTASDKLFSVDARTGQPDPDFGEGGYVELLQGSDRPVNPDMTGVTSPPIVCDGVVVVGSAMNDWRFRSPPAYTPPGDVRGFDARTGKMRWIFHTIPRAGEYGAETWTDGANEHFGAANVWAAMSADDELGIVYLPIGTPTNDWYGGLRKGDNLFAESLVAVDVDTGQLIWHFQTVHHGVWDYDLPAAPTLIDIKVEGRDIKAVAQISKQGFTYVFDRITGEPVWPIEERSVPQSTVPGEQLSATQPFPTKPAPFEPQGISDETLIDFTPQLREEALQNIEVFDYGPLFTPPSLRGAIQFPGWAGGGEWHGAAFDPITGLYYVPSASGPIVVQLTEADPSESNLIYRRGGARSVSGPQGLPLTKPPYGRITAIDMNSGEHRWVIPHGQGIRQEIIEKGIIDPGPVGSTHRVGPVLTETLLFFAQIDGDRNLLRAFDKSNGAVIYEYELPLAPQGTPMTYMIDGKQYITIAVGGRQDARLISLSLP